MSDKWIYFLAGLGIGYGAYWLLEDEHKKNQQKLKQRFSQPVLDRSMEDVGNILYKSMSDFDHKNNLRNNRRV